MSAVGETVPLGAGDVVAGRFELLGLLGGGGEGETWLAVDRDLNARTVLKVRRCAGDPAASEGSLPSLQRFRREARLLRQLVPHPALPVVRWECTIPGRHVLVVDEVPGETLASWLARQGDPGLPLDQVVDVVGQLADALDHLHRHHPAVVHGDVKPANAIRRPDGRIALVDFGLARPLAPRRESGPTDGMASNGTDGYRAPEVTAGEPPTVASDVYALAATTYVLLTNHHALGGQPRWPAEIDAAERALIEPLIRRAMSFDPSRRPPSAGDFADRLRRLVRSRSPEGTVVTCAMRVAAEVAGEVHAALEAAGAIRVRPLNGAGEDNATQLAVVAFHQGGHAAAVALELSDRFGDLVDVAMHAGEVGGYFGQPLQELINTTIGLLSETGPPKDDRRGGVIASPAAARMAHAALGPLVHLAAGDGVARVRLDRVIPAAEAPPPRLLPAPLRRYRPATVGRHHELAGIEAALDAAVERNSVELLVLVGDAGMGKTHLLAHAAQEAFDRRGADVWFGRCSPMGPPLEALQPLLDHASSRSGGPRRPSMEEHTDQRARNALLAGAFASVRDRAPDAPQLLVIDDLHWADASTVAALRFLLLDAPVERLLIIAAARSERLRTARTELDWLLAEPDVRTMAIAGLPPTAAAELGRQQGLSSSAAAALPDLTAGNPFFVVQLARSASGDDRPMSRQLPEGVLAWLRQRIDQLPEPTRVTLVTAAAIGRDIDPGIVGEVLGSDPAAVLEDLDAAVRLGLIDDVHDAGVQFRFRHGLVVAALCDRLARSQSAALALRIGLVEHDRASSLPDGPQRRALRWRAAHRLLDAGPRGDLTRAAQLAAVAVAEALDGDAPETALTLARQAIAVLGGTARSTPTLTTHLGVLHLHHGRALLALSQMGEARRSLFAAADIARAVRDRTLLAATARVAAHLRAHTQTDEDLIGLLSEALEGCEPGDARSRALLSASLSRLLPATTPAALTSARRLARDAQHAAAELEPLDRDEVLIDVLRTKWSATDVHDRLHTAGELISVHGSAAVDRGLVLSARRAAIAVRALQIRAGAAVQLGGLAEAAVDAQRACELAAQIGSTFLSSSSMVTHAMVLIAQGRYDEGWQLGHEAVAVGAERQNVMLNLAGQVWAVQRDRGEHRQLVGLADLLDDAYGSIPFFTAAASVSCAEFGDLAAAGRWYERTCALTAPPERLPDDWLWLATMCLLIEAAAFNGDAATVSRVAARLGAHAGQLALAAGELVCVGPVSRYLGIAAAATADLDDAVDHLLLAAGQSQSAGSVPFHARSLHEASLVHRRQGRRRDADRLADRARTVAADIGLHLPERTAVATPPPPGHSPQGT